MIGIVNQLFMQEHNMKEVENEKSQLIAKLNDCWNAANYLSAAQIYLQGNPLLKEPLGPQHIKPRLLGHWGTSPGLNFIYVHLNQLIKNRGAKVLFMAGPGHGAPSVLSSVYLEGSLSRHYPNITQNEMGLLKLVRRFSTPGGFPSHVSAHVPGSIHEGGELGYVLSHAFGVAFDQPDLLVACVIGDGEAETGPLAGSWKSVQFLNPKRDGAVLPILHLNGYKISSPTVLSRYSDQQLRDYFTGQGYEAYFVEGEEPLSAHGRMLEVMNQAYARILQIQQTARESNLANAQSQLPWPVIVLRTPKGWTGPKAWEGKKIEGSYRSHQIPLKDVRNSPEQLKLLEQWLRSYHPEKLFEPSGRLRQDLVDLMPAPEQCMGMCISANGGQQLIKLQLPSFLDYAIKVAAPGTIQAEATRVLGSYLRDVFVNNEQEQNFRIFCPDETNSNRLERVFDVTDRCTMQPLLAEDEQLSPNGRVMEVLSEHLCQGWLEGYLLSGRHGLFPCYEAFATIVDSMVSQHAKWLKMSAEISWRKPIASLNYLLSSHSWRQDHNGYSHQGPGFIDTLMNKHRGVTAIYLPCDANSLLVVADQCLKSSNVINLIIAGKQPQLQWMDISEAIMHCRQGASIWDWAGSDKPGSCDIVLACAGDVPTLETIAAAWLIKKHLPELKISVVNVVNLLCLAPQEVHPAGLDDETFNSLFTQDKHVVFAFHGYAAAIHGLIHGRANPDRFHVRGYKEEGTTTTPFDMVVLNGISRFHLAIEAIKRTIGIDDDRARPFIKLIEDKLRLHKQYIQTHFDDLPEIKGWKWTSTSGK